MSAVTFKVGDRVVTVPGPKFGYSWEEPRVGTVTGHHMSDLHFVVFDDEDDLAMMEEGWLLRDHEIKHIDSEENNMVNIEDMTTEEIEEILATGSPSYRAEVFIQTLEKSGRSVREALKALVMAVDRADATVNEAIERGDLSDTDEWFFSGVQTAADGANEFMQYFLQWGVAPEIDAWT